ncbi:MAG: ATP-binding cassette domain-containing protein [Exilispira sp.]
MPDIKNLSILKQNVEKTKTSWEPIISILEEKEEKIEDKIPSNFEFSLDNLSIIVRNNKIIDGINLNIKKKEKLVITGKSGEGKSVLLNSLI